MKYKTWMDFIGCIEEWERQEPVQVYDGAEWKLLKKKDFESFPKLRIKPQEPREFWMYPVPGGFHVGMDGQTAKDYSGVIKVREVL